jgi:hypothetical protein
MGSILFLSVCYDSFLLRFRQPLFFFFKIKVYELTELGKRIGNLIGFLVLVNFAWILSVGWLSVDFGFVDVFIHCAKKVSRIRMGSLGLFLRLGLAYEFVEREFSGLNNCFSAILLTPYFFFSPLPITTQGLGFHSILIAHFIWQW